ncbi:MAG: NUDIX hydrolase [Myxococcota bacterium]
MSETNTGFSRPGTPEGAPRLAATVMLLRDRAPGDLEVFMVKRSGKSAFMGGAYVFPGGKVDADDQVPEAVVASSVERALERLPDRTLGLGLLVGAAREVFEEAGVLLGAGPGMDHTALAAARAALNTKQRRFTELLPGPLDLSSLSPWARWITPSKEPRRFDTYFFLARDPGQRASSDAYETTDAAWLTPAEALAKHDAGQIMLPPPTLINLIELSGLASSSAALAAADARSLAPILPKLGVDADRIAIFMPWAPEYADLEGEGTTMTRDHPCRGPLDRVILDGERWIAR